MEIDSTTIETVKQGISMAQVAVSAVIALVSFIVGRIHALRKKR
jgi:hypothetical protein